MVEYSVVNISPEEAAEALNGIEASRRAMRSLVRAHRGHMFLWLWGGVWMASSVLNGWDERRFWFPAACLFWVGLLATFAIAYAQRGQFRSPFDRRFLAVCATLLLFGYGVWPVLLGWPHSAKAGYAYGTLLWMQVYVVAGIWFDNYWLWIGIVMTALILAGFILFPGAFWVFSLLGGATMVGTGFYVRHFWL